ncbi:putative telomerase reverse transcriptase [Leishmania infantum JPCM5]|uniref:Telomerase reverse transcriptase n=2 Tax=Leishmania infantum TaxID=5671 RepID=A4ID03_LEIIN|nr:putative telomerase reverse transcriptase [Leishmania infantum JPCM5]CAC9551521.1 telomerase_reverse_transcriptase_-_putative [Leishmania infantum]CAM72732.1 putative telomerase reverse transcriptase [Leishmania infantum JPCM5]SUZ46791.1 telomerase_reverse_transcriptase_-_putative [Leishmania infantum]|eukprot:XP_001469622.1 putative telomerase reverse transcriptase [Leishmania infantum JPCM5]
MSASFPSIPGFAGPLSLKAFLEEYFGLHLTFAVETASPSPRAAAAAEAPSAAGFRALRDVVLPPNQSFLVVVYVALHASSSPPPTTAHASPTPPTPAPGCAASATGFGRLRQPLTHQTAASTAHDTYVARCSPADRPNSSCSSSSSTGKNGNARGLWRSSAFWLLYTNTSHRPLTDALLRHPWWASFAACLGPAAMGFIEMYCPIVLQLEAMAGGVQVLGPALKHAALETSFSATAPSSEMKGPPPQGSGYVSSRGVKRAVDTGECSGFLPLQKQRRVEAPPKAKAGRRLQRGVVPCSRPRRDDPFASPVNRAAMPVTWAAALTRTDVPRTRLYSVRVSDSDGAGDGSGGALPLPAGFLEAQWLRRHPHSLHRVLQAALPKRVAYGASARRYSVGASERVTGCTSVEDIPMWHVAHVFRWLVLQPPQSGADASPTTPPKFDLPSYLRRLLSTVVDQCSRLDLRGAALKHTGYLEEAFRRQQQGVEPWDVQRLSTPVDVVVSYLRTLLSTLRWAPLKEAKNRSFWGRDAAGSERVLDALMGAVRNWLIAGRHAIVPVSRFLDGVPVAQVPWLNGFYTTTPSLPFSAATSSAARHARRERSHVQQRVWLQFVLFLTQDILPFLLRASFTITWSSKNTHKLLFFPAFVWRRLIRREVRRTRSCGAPRSQMPLAGESARSVGAERVALSSAPCACEGAATAALPTPHSAASKASAAISAPRDVWRAVRTDGVLAHRGARATLATRGGGASCLYASVRFRPDRRKLRPIAVVRSASLRSLKEMARGSPSPYSHASAIVRLLCRLGCSDTDGQLPAATATLLRRVQARSRHNHHTGVHRFPHPLPPHLPHKAALRDALRCLVSGVEEQRVRDGLPRLSNLSHQDEYAELRSFCEEVRRRPALPCEGPAGTAPVVSSASPPSAAACCFAPYVTLVRSDASRCYDNLPQERVLAAVASLVKHDAYRVLRFTAIHALDGEAACKGGCLLRRTFTTRTIACAEAECGVLARIPRGHIYWEEEEEGRTLSGPHTTAAVSRTTKASSRCGANLISGAAVRALLSEHLRHHLVVVSGGNLLEQRVGILQGSPVAMLLCDRLFSDVVDTALSGILSEHAERSLLLRRVDDVLVATTSPAAAERCLQAMQRGWPSVGYLSNPSKLTLSTACGSLVPWCGLLLHDTTLEVSVEWRRIGVLLASLRVGDPHYVHRGDHEPLYLTQRFLAVLQLRVAPTVLCGRMNSKTRQLQTFYEVGLLWSRVVLEKVQEALPAARNRCVAVLLLHPLAVCVGRLCRLLNRHQRFLAARKSACDVSAAEVRACVLTALHRTVQAKLRVLQARTVRVMTAQRGRTPRGTSLKGRQKPPCTNKASSAGCKYCERRRKGRNRRCSTRVCLRSFWWLAAAEVELQWRRSLGALHRAAPHPGEARGSTAPSLSPSASASLLMEDGPLSMHARALSATRLSQT